MSQKLILRISAVVSGVSGVVILFGVLLPILFYENGSRELVSPVLEENTSSSEIEKIDFTRASNWFVGGARAEDFASSNISFYTLSIPALRIKNATVAIGGEDLSKHLVQYPGTALPGKRGNAVVFGHSILPIFYNPENYISIFSTLPTLRKGDEIGISYDGVSYKYKVYNMFEVFPTDLEVLKQDKSDSFLTLVTCVPPGDPRKPKRLIVRARVILPEEAYANTWH